MARLQTRIGMMLVLLMFMAGCIYNDTPEWGTGDGQVFVEIDGSSANIESKMGEGFEETISIVGCGESKMKVTGMLISSEVYSEHPVLSDVQSAMGAAVIIHTMSWNSAESVEEGKAGRVSLKDWSEPLNPSEAVGSKLSDNEDDWEVIGIIPASENVANGLNIVQHWHEPIELKGYVLDGNGLAGVNSETCVLEGQGHGMIVTSIKTSQGVVSLDGDHDDEYSLGDTDLFGGWTFILFFLIFGVGGGIGLFIVSTMVTRQGARATAEALLGREGFAKSIQMKKDIKQSKKDGLQTPAERSAPKKRTAPPQKKRKEQDVAIPGFSLDSVLQSDNDDSGPKTFGGGNSVVVTNEAKEMESSRPVASSMPQITNSPMPSAGVVSSQPEPAKREHFSSSMSRSVTQPTPAAEPSKGSRPVKRRSVKKRASQPEPEPDRVVENKRASIADDDEFSDFSF
ncbi:hypothetical protein N9U68_00720 [Euryarchaeota archaeon]|nr:hypothetical protein [Euryarchaeota archaeon]